MKPKILIVEDEPAIADNIQYVLESEGLDTIHATTGRAVASLLSAHAIDLILLDVGLPDMTGFDLLKEIRRQHATPIIFLTARNTEIDRVLGLEIGADDYIAKPFSPRELAARVKVVLRRTRPAATSEVTMSARQASSDGVGSTAAPASRGAAAFVVNTARRQVTFRGQALELSKYEYEILTTFIRRPGHVLSRDQLMELVWEEPGTSLDRTVDAHIKNIRAKLRAVAPDADPIATHRGSGYSLRDDP
ncbi:MAG TPA: two-component system response regulator CreB [Polyangia bacterium]